MVNFTHVYLSTWRRRHWLLTEKLWDWCAKCICTCCRQNAAHHTRTSLTELRFAYRLPFVDLPVLYIRVNEYEVCLNANASVQRTHCAIKRTVQRVWQFSASLYSASLSSASLYCAILPTPRVLYNRAFSK